MLASVTLRFGDNKHLLIHWFESDEKEPTCSIASPHCIKGNYDMCECQQLPAPHVTSNETDVPQQTIDGLKITAKQQSTNQYNFHVYITTKLTNPNHDQRHKYHHLMMTLNLLDSEDDYCSVSWNVSHQQQSLDYPHPVITLDKHMGVL